MASLRMLVKICFLCFPTVLKVFNGIDVFFFSIGDYREIEKFSSKANIFFILLQTWKFLTYVLLKAEILLIIINHLTKNMNQQKLKKNYTFIFTCINDNYIKKYGLMQLKKKKKKKKKKHHYMVDI